MVAELLRWRAPIPLVLLCVLLGFHPRLQHKQDCPTRDVRRYFKFGSIVPVLTPEEL